MSFAAAAGRSRIDIPDTKSTKSKGAVIDAVTSAVLERCYCESVESEGAPSRSTDSGPIVLAALADGPSQGEPAGLVLDYWLDEIDDHVNHLGMFGDGLGGYVSGAMYGARTKFPRLIPIEARLVQSYCELAMIIYARSSREIGWHCYDLVTGPAGIVMTLDGADPSDELVTTARTLSRQRLLDAIGSNDGTGMRPTIYGEDPLRSWNNGRVNTGVAHGLSGVIGALTSLAGSGAHFDPVVTEVLAETAHQLAKEVYVDSRGLYTWSPAMRDGAYPPGGYATRQAWCYGTPGVAWTLWNAGDCLDDDYLCELAAAALESYVNTFEPELYFGSVDFNNADRLGICHGASGVLLIADAFRTHSSFAVASELVDEALSFVLEQPEAIVALAEENTSIMSGASGVAAALLTVSQHGVDRSWLRQFELR